MLATQGFAEDINVISNDTDGDNTNDELSVSSFTKPSHGKVTKKDDHTLTYTANAKPVLQDQVSDSFTYKATDGAANSNVATVEITVYPD